jgi:hypothetical protein
MVSSWRKWRSTPGGARAALCLVCAASLAVPSCATAPTPPRPATVTPAAGEAPPASSGAGLESAGTWLLIGAGIGSGAGPIGAGAGALAGLVYGLTRRAAVRRDDAREAARQQELTAAQARELEARAAAVPEAAAGGGPPAADVAAAPPSPEEVRGRELEGALEAERAREQQLLARLRAVESPPRGPQVIRYHEKGVLVREERLDAAGETTEVLVYDPAGNLVRREERRHGTAVVLSHYEAGRLVRHELFTLHAIPVPRAPRVSAGRAADAAPEAAAPKGPAAGTTDPGEAP